MTAEPAGPSGWAPDPLRQRARAYPLEDLLTLPDDAPRVELTDGVLSVVPPLVLSAPFAIRLPIRDITP